MKEGVKGVTKVERRRASTEMPRDASDGRVSGLVHKKKRSSRISKIDQRNYLNGICDKPVVGEDVSIIEISILFFQKWKGRAQM